MNFLAHIYLSGNDSNLMLGNFIADHVKGRAFNELDEGLKKGVILHRKIDLFTDLHPIVMQSKERMRPVFRKFAPVVADVFYDHFLAANWHKYSPVKLHEFAAGFYALATSHLHLMPERTRIMLPYMISNNWLVTYASVEGIGKVMNGMAKRTKFISGMESASAELQKNYRLYENDFSLFFIELQEYAELEIHKLNSL